MSSVLDKNVLKFHKIVDEQQYYEAHQFLRTIVNRYVKMGQYERSIDLLYLSSKRLFDAGQFASGGDLALYMIKIYHIIKLKPDAMNKARIYDLLRLSRPEEPTRKRMIHEALAWSGRYGNIPVGDLELHYEIGKIFTEGIDLINEKVAKYIEDNLFEAEKHLVLGENNSFELLMNLLCGYFDQDTFNTIPLYTSRAVFPYLILQNMAYATQAYKRMAQHLIEQRKVATQALSSSSIDIILFPSLPLMNFLYFLILTCQRAASDLFYTLKAHYADILKQVPSWQMSLEKIADLYFNVRPEQSSTNTWTDLMRQFFGAETSSCNATQEALHETLD
ncbi:hypothetical protein PCANB_002435 [Pneumocystis canis]|nr:hypothetical protein PCK1_002551 [Pneumocystis canis]KAG5438715.1 hypothetical protein PCANB_002435 [Pneumocystis canis]